MTKTPANEQQLIQAAKTFGATVLELHAEQWNKDGTLPRQFFSDAAAIGLCGLLVPQALGGADLSMSAFAQILRALAGHCMASTFALVVHNNLAAAIARSGHHALSEQYLQPMLRGEQIGAFLLTEPGVGSDAAAITTSAKMAGDGWLLNGAKAWISNAAHADVLSVYAQTGKIGDPRGIACFLVGADAAGVTRAPSYELLGGHALGTGGFAFDNCRIADEAMMFAPGEAFRAAMRGINLARCSVAAMSCGMLTRALTEALRYTKARSAFGSQIGDFQGVQWMLADSATDLEAAQALTGIAMARLEEGSDATLAAAHAKKFATRIAFSRIADCMQVMGAVGLRSNYPLARHLAAAKIAQYLDGATEIQNVVIARQLHDVYAT